MTSNIVKHSEYDIEKLTFNPLTNPKKKALQTILLPSYDGGRGPLIQLPSIELDMYGIPSKTKRTPKQKNLRKGFLRNLTTN